MANTPKLGIRLIEGTDVVNFQGMNNILNQIDQHGHPAGDITGILSPEHGGTGKASLDEALAGYLPLTGGNMSGTLDVPTIKESGVSLENKYAPKTHTHRASDITNIRDYIRDTFYPIGKIWKSTDPTSPAAIVGGTWEAIESGRFLVAAGGDYAVGSKGGAASVSLTADQNAPHRHRQNVNGYNYVMEESVHLGNGNNGAGNGYYIGQSSYGAVSGPIYTSDAGKGAPIEILPPFYAVYMWRRIA